MKAKTYSALQKTYDQAYLTCSTAVYYESLGNEIDALRCWRECLGQLQNCSSANHKPRSETEHALLCSLRNMREQCEDRAGLLQAIIESKRESGGRSLSSSPPPPLTPPVLPDRPPTAGAVLLGSRRSPSPDKRPTGFLSTLRPPRKIKRESGSFDSLRKSAGGPRTATQAATLAWSSISRREGEGISQSLSVPTMETLVKRPVLGERSSTGDLPMRERERRPSYSGSLGEQGQQQQQQHDGRPPCPGYLREGEQECLPGVRQRPNLGRMKTRPRSSMLPMGSPTHGASDGCPPSPPPPPPPHRVLNQRESLRKPVPRNDFYTAHGNYGMDSAIPPPLPPKVPPKLSAKPDRLKNLQTDGLESARGRGCSDSADMSPTYLANTIRTRSPRDSPDENTSQYSDDSRPSMAISDDQEWKDRIEQAKKSIGKGVDLDAVNQVANEIVVKGDEVHWDDVAGLEGAKQALKEAVVYPFLRPDLFSGLREPAKGMLLFGPPGTGKTMLARAVATESKSTFFSISASSLTSKYLGESEKLVRALFALAKALAPSIIFVDEIDSLLSARAGGEHEATRRLKTEFLIQWSDLARAAAGKETASSSTIGDPSRVLVLAATNLPWAIDEAARRRFARRQYIPLPEDETRNKQFCNLLGRQNHVLSVEEMAQLVQMTSGFSGSDITALAKDAAMGPLRSLGERLLEVGVEDVRAIGMGDFVKSLESIRPSVSKEGLKEFEEWAAKYGERV